MDIFDENIICKQCKKEMVPTEVHREGFQLRAVQCPSCESIIVHPEDTQKLYDFKQIRGKTFHVKLRVVGNSHAISIPKEIVEFIEDQHRMMSRHMDDMVRLCFEDRGKLSLNFNQATNRKR